MSVFRSFLWKGRKMKHKELAKTVVDLIGGSTNINQVWNCFTRVRFNVVDEKKIKTSEIEKLEGVLGVRLQNGQLQVIVGNEASKVFEAIEQLELESASNQPSVNKGNIVTEILDILSGVFTPILPAIIAAGMLKALLALVGVFNLLPADSGLLALLNVISDAAFYFMPFLLAVSASRKFKTNEFLGLSLAGILMYPTFAAGAAEGADPLSLFFLKVPFANYSTSVIPILLGVYVLSIVYRFTDKYIPQMFKIILTPLIAILITAPITLVFLAPLGSYVGVYLASAINWLLSVAAPVAGFVATGGMSLIVMTGMHYAFFPGAIQSLGANGYDMFLLPSNIIANLAQAGATFAVGFKAKDKKVKSMAVSTGISAVFGITEPAIYGVNMKYKKPFYAAMLAGAISGGVAFTFGLKAFAFAAPGILSLPAYIDPSGAALNFTVAILAVLSSFVMGFGFTLLFKVDTNQTTNNPTINPREISIKNPIDGKIIQLSEVNDETFAEGIMGKGIAIEPTSNKVYAPCDGKIVTIFKTKHAISLTSTDGVELLIHIGLDTVNLNGKHFVSHINDGQIVKQGDLLLEFDAEKIKEENYDLTTELVVINSSEYSEIYPMTNTDHLEHNQEIIKLFK